jgi:hypothetical protein
MRLLSPIYSSQPLCFLGIKDRSSSSLVSRAISTLNQSSSPSVFTRYIVDKNIRGGMRKAMVPNAEEAARKHEAYKPATCGVVFNESERDPISVSWREHQ